MNGNAYHAAMPPRHDARANVERPPVVRGDKGRKGPKGLMGRRTGSATRWGIRRGLVAALSMAGVLVASAQLIAASGGLMSTVVDQKSGLTLSVNTAWVEGRGYCPVRVTYSTSKPATSDRSLTIRFRLDSYYRSHSHLIEVEQRIAIPAGSGTGEAIVAVPHYSSRWTVSWDVWIDGRYAEKLSLQGQPDRNNSQFEASGMMPRMVIVREPQDPLEPLYGILSWRQKHAQRQDGYMMGGAAGGTTVGALGQVLDFTTQGRAQLLVDSLPEMVKMVPAALPVRWIDYNAIDIVCIDLQRLRALETGHPQAWQAIRQWTYAGGNLWVYAVGDQWEGLEDLQQALSLPVEDVPAADDSVRPVWIEPVSRPTHWGQYPGRGDSSPTVGNGRPSPLSTDSNIFPGLFPKKEPWIYQRDYGLGRLVALKDEKALATDERFEAVLKSQGHDRLIWTHRHGLLTEQGNVDFWNFLLPGVGLAPVIQFQVLITLFVLLIGPVSFYWLRRYQVLHLSLLTVPTGALIATAGLFAYAILADGLSVRTRARSYTALDQRTGQSATWARVSYYAGLAPSDPLVFPADTVVLPMPAEHGRSGRGRDELVSRDMRWDDAQRLTRGWLKSRTPTQLLTVRCRASDRKLVVHESAAGVTVENRLGTDIETLYLIDSTGQLHHGRAPLMIGKRTTALTAVALDEGAKQLQAILVANRPKLPAELPPELSAAGQGWSYGGRNAPAGWPRPNQASARLEAAITPWTEPPTVRTGVWQPKTYVAIVDESPDFVSGTKEAREEAGLHLIVGRW